MIIIREKDYCSGIEIMPFYSITSSNLDDENLYENNELYFYMLQTVPKSMMVIS